MHSLKNLSAIRSAACACTDLQHHMPDISQVCQALEYCILPCQFVPCQLDTVLQSAKPAMLH